MSSAEFRAAMLEVVARAAEVRESFADEVQARRDAAVSARLVSGDTEGLLSALPVAWRSRAPAELLGRSPADQGEDQGVPGATR